MAEILLFHHAQGQTDGFLAFADELRAAGHGVHAPDLYDGKTFADITEGVGYAKQVGFGTIIERGVAAAEGLPGELVYAGFSLGVLPAQMLTQTRPGAKGTLLLQKRQRCSKNASSCSWNASVSGNRLRHQHVIDRHHSAAGADGQAELAAKHPLGLIPVAFVQSACRGVH